MLEFILANGERQRKMDERYRHFAYMVGLQDPDEKKTIDEWAKQILRATGWDDGAFPNRQQRVKAQEFAEQYRNLGITMADSYTPPRVPVPRKCDECKKPCTSECFCGEIIHHTPSIHPYQPTLSTTLPPTGELYCSRDCLGKAWKSGHRKLCEMVFDNGKTACILTQTEMQKTLTKAEYDFATGCSRPFCTATKATAGRPGGAGGATKTGASAAATASAATASARASAIAANDAAQRQRDKDELDRMVASDPSPAAKA